MVAAALVWPTRPGGEKKLGSSDTDDTTGGHESPIPIHTHLPLFGVWISRRLRYNCELQLGEMDF
jgi:hypothetical protein